MGRCAGAKPVSESARAGKRPVSSSASPAVMTSSPGPGHTSIGMPTRMSTMPAIVVQLLQRTLVLSGCSDAAESPLGGAIVRFGAPRRIRISVTALRKRRPWPLDDGGSVQAANPAPHDREDSSRRSRSASSRPAQSLHTMRPPDDQRALGVRSQRTRFSNTQRRSRTCWRFLGFRDSVRGRCSSAA